MRNPKQHPAPAELGEIPLRFSSKMWMQLPWTTPTATLLRWLTGPRFSALPIKSADHPAPKLSFEFSPPRTEALEQQLWTCIERLAPLVPRFVSVTYGAGGSTQARTHATVARIAREGSWSRQPI